TQKEVEKNLVKIKWLPKSQNKTLAVTKINDVDKKLEAISNELENLPLDLKKYVLNPSGVYNYRKISRTNRLSVHSFGIAIDINLDFSNYWQWDEKDEKIEYKNKIPLEIVEIFEKYGFIWGGRWYHFDTMHFEYRPELLVD
ncbi:M15 family metallopeptidase, partial [Aliarcobacter butzleri]